MSTADAQEHAELAEARRLFFEFYRAVPTQPTAVEAGFLAQGEDLGIELGGAPVVARGFGRGPLILFLHGLYGRGGQFRAFVKQATEKGFRAVVFDAPGNGASPAAGVHTDLTLAAIRRILEVEGTQPHAAVAHSLGCIWALHGTRHGIEPRRIVCISPPTVNGVLVKKFLQLHAASPGVARKLDRMFAGFEGGDPWGMYSPVDVARRLALPGLVIHGQADDFVEPENGRLLAEAWAGAALVLVPERNHFDILHDRSVVRTSIEFAMRAR